MFESHYHPIWSLLRFVAIVLAVTALLYRNANSFDETEIKTIIEIAILAGGFEVSRTAVHSYTKRHNHEQSTDTLPD